MLSSEVSLQGASVLDLYAGSGALGLEAVSRGAANATLVEGSRNASKTAQRNVRALGVQSQVKVATKRVAQFLAGASGQFDVAFLDPPYNLSNEQLKEDLVALEPLLIGPKMVVVERSKEAGEPLVPAGMGILKSRVWGGTAAWFLTSPAPEDAEGSQKNVKDSEET